MSTHGCYTSLTFEKKIQELKEVQRGAKTVISQ